MFIKCTVFCSPLVLRLAVSSLGNQVLWFCFCNSTESQNSVVNYQFEDVCSVIKKVVSPHFLQQLSLAASVAILFNKNSVGIYSMISVTKY